MAWLPISFTPYASLDSDSQFFTQLLLFPIHICHRKATRFVICARLPIDMPVGTSKHHDPDSHGRKEAVSDHANGISGGPSERPLLVAIEPDGNVIGECHG